MIWFPYFLPLKELDVCSDVIQYNSFFIHENYILRTNFKYNRIKRINIKRSTCFHIDLTFGKCFISAIFSLKWLNKIEVENHNFEVSWKSIIVSRAGPTQGAAIYWKGRKIRKWWNAKHIIDTLQPQDRIKSVIFDKNAFSYDEEALHHLVTQGRMRRAPDGLLCINWRHFVRLTYLKW